MVLSVLTAAAATQSVVQGGVLLFVFGIGRVLPLLGAGLSAGLLRRLQAGSRFAPYLEKACGLAFVALGLYYWYLTWPVGEWLLVSAL